LLILCWGRSMLSYSRFWSRFIKIILLHMSCYPFSPFNWSSLHPLKLKTFVNCMSRLSAVITLCNIPSSTTNTLKLLLLIQRLLCAIRWVLKWTLRRITRRQGLLLIRPLLKLHPLLWQKCWGPKLSLMRSLNFLLFFFLNDYATGLAYRRQRIQHQNVAPKHLIGFIQPHQKLH